MLEQDSNLKFFSVPEFHKSEFSIDTYWNEYETKFSEGLIQQFDRF